MNYVYFQHFTLNKNYFVQYRVFDLKLNDIRSIKGIKNARIFINIDKIRINIVIDNQKKNLFLRMFFLFQIYF